MGLLAWLGLAVAPTDAVQKDAQRLMYVHVPAAWLAYLAFGVTAVCSALYLWPRTRSLHYDRLAGASAEIGVLFTALTLALGSIWGRPVWGTWWTWDARLVTTAILFFLYLGYLALRRVPDDPQVRARRSAIAALIAVVDVPIVHFSVSWWRTLHQEGTVFGEDRDAQLDSTMAWILMLGVVTFTLVYLYLVLRRYDLAGIEEATDERQLERAIVERRAEAVSTPTPAPASPGGPTPVGAASGAGGGTP
jgi:heme exporter protein C